MASVAILDSWTLVSTGTGAPGSKTVSAGTNRVLFYVTLLRDNPAQEVLTVSYGGQAMTRLVHNETAGATGNDIHAAVWALGEAGIVAATDSNFAITRELANGIRYRAAAAVYQNVDQNDFTVDEFAVLGTTGTDPVPEVLDTVNNGFVIAAQNGADSSGGTQDITWSNLTQQLENGDTVHYLSVAHAAITTGGTLTPAFTLSFDTQSVMWGVSLRTAKTNVAAGLTSETDTAQSISPAKRRTLGLASETDTATALGPTKFIAVGQASEADTAQEHRVNDNQVATRLQNWSVVAFSSSEIGTGVSYSIPAGNARLLVVGISEESTSHEPVGVTYGGQALTQAAIAQSVGTVKESGSLWYLKEAGIVAASGTTLAATFDGAHDGQLRCMVAVYRDVFQGATTVLDTHSDDVEDAPPDPAVLTTSGRGVAIGLMASDQAGIDVTWGGALVVERLENVASSNYVSIADVQTDGKDQTMAPVFGGLARVAFVAFSIKGTGLTAAVGQATEADTANGVISGTPAVRILDPWLLASDFIDTPGSRTVSGGGRRVLLYKVALRSADETITAVSYGGQTMTLVTTGLTAGVSGSDIHSSWWLLGEAGIQAAVGTAFSVTRSGAGGVAYRAHSASYTGVDSVDPTVDESTVLATAGADPVAEAIDTVAGGVVVAALSGADESGGTQDATWVNLVEQAEARTTTIYESIARALVVGTPLTPDFTLANNTQSILSAISLRAGGSGIDVGNAAEIDTAQPIGHARIKSMGLSSETDSAQSIRPARIQPVGQSAEIDSAQNIIGRIGTGINVGQASETDSAFEITVVLPNREPVGQASETDSALSIRPARPTAIGLASETDTTFGVGHSKRAQVGQAIESDQAQSIVVQGQADEVAARKRLDGGGGAPARARRAQLEARARRYAEIQSEDEELVAIVAALTAAMGR